MATAIMKQKEAPETDDVEEIISKISEESPYANQIKYHKVTGEKPGKELKSWSYSVKEVADLLEVDDYLVYDLLKKN